MGNVSKRVKYGRFYYVEYFLVGFLTELCLYIYEHSMCTYVRLNALNELNVHGPCLKAS